MGEAKHRKTSATSYPRVLTVPDVVAEDGRCLEVVSVTAVLVVRERAQPGRPLPIDPSVTVAVGSYYDEELFWLTEPLSVDEGVRLGDAVRAVTQTGPRTGDVAAMGSVPGTIVWPTLEQRRAGREPVMARIVHRSERRYSADELWAAVR